MTANLTVIDRLVLLGALGTEEGSLLEIRLRRDLTQKVGFSAEEQERRNLRMEGSQYRVDDNSPAALEFLPAEAAHIAGKLRALDAAQKVTPQHLPLFDLFCADPD